MTTIGYILFIMGISLGSLFAARPNPNWFLLCANTLIGLLGVFILRVRKRSPAGEVKSRTDLNQIHKELNRIYDDTKRLDYQWNKLNTDQKKSKLEEISGLIVSLVDKRSAIVANMGYRKFSELFVPLAQGERYLHRAWSALVDVHDEEAIQSLRSAMAHFSEMVSSHERPLR
jgi:hypothetical protein